MTMLLATVLNEACIGKVPVGASVLWHRNLKGTPQTLPEQFVECNGQVLDDRTSPLHGNRMPDWNTKAEIKDGPIWIIRIK